MKVSSVNNNTYAPCQNRPQNFGAVRMNLIDASKLKFKGERYLPRSARGILDSLTESTLIPAETRTRASEIRRSLGKEDVILTNQEMSAYDGIKQYEEQGIFAPGEALGTLEFVIKYAETLNLKDFAQRVANFDAKGEAKMPKGVEPLKALGDGFKRLRDKLFEWAEGTTHLPAKASVDEFGPATGPTGTIITHNGVPQLIIQQ